MNYLHVAVIEDFEECFIAPTEPELREQVNGFLVKHSITPPTDAEWAVCILAKIEAEIPIENLTAVGLISYYKADVGIGKESLIKKLQAMQ
ncbi:MAG: hypothetical protein ABI778_09680 [Ignavibacteriota bacterium]